MIIAFTGSGISKESGIPTFEDMGDLREKLSRDFANNHPDEYAKTIDVLVKAVDKAEPNRAHLALAEYGVPIITMNVDGLHQKAGSKDVVALHGSLPDNVVLYGDPAPNYAIGMTWVDYLGPGDILLVVGASNYTNIASMLRILARSNGARVVEIQDNATIKVEGFLCNHKGDIESLESFLARQEN